MATFMYKELVQNKAALFGLPEGYLVFAIRGRWLQVKHFILLNVGCHRHSCTVVLSHRSLQFKAHCSFHVTKE